MDILIEMNEKLKIPV